MARDYFLRKLTSEAQGESFMSDIVPRSVPAEPFLFFWTLSLLLDFVSSAEPALRIAGGEVFAPLLIIFSFVSLLGSLVLSQRRRCSLLQLGLFLHIVLVGILLPEAPNHRVLAALINISLLVETFKSRGVSLSQRFISAGRVILSITYFFACFHKLNSDYLNPALSCATEFTRQIVESYPTFFWVSPAKIYPAVTSIVLEGILALLVFFPYRAVGVIVFAAFVFHTLLAFHPTRHFFDFASTMMALFLLFLPPGNLRPPRFLALTLALGLVASFLLLLNAADENSLGAAYLLRQRTWYLVAASLFYYGFSLMRADTLPLKNTLKWGWLNLALIAITLINGFGPYLGVKTRFAFDMYSNLRVEGGLSNHLLIPARAQAGLLTHDVVDVVAIEGGTYSFPTLRQEMLVPGKQIVRFELASLLTRNPGLQVLIRDGGSERKVERPDDVYPSGWVPSWFLRKVIAFRPVEYPDEPMSCTW